MNFTIRPYRLPHNGNIPGARGHKRIVVPRGTLVYYIVCQGRIYWCCYLNEADALKCAEGLEKTVDYTSKQKRHISLNTLLDWNFKHDIPLRVHRPKVS